MKVAICSHFGGFQSSYALHVGWHERARLLERYGVQFDFFVNTKCKENLYPSQRNCLPNPPSGKPFSDRVALFTNAYVDLLEDYDVILTVDMLYQKKGNFLACNAAMREASKKLKAWWCHWIHSGWIHPEPESRYPENLRFSLPPRSFLVYLNSFELPELAKMYGIPLDNQYTYAVYNPKDIRSFYEMDALVWTICDRLDLPNKDVVQVFPVCATRMDSKGIDGVIHTIAACKRAGRKVALIVADANSRKRKEEVDAKKAFMNGLGLVENSDYLWTSDINNRQPISRKTVADLFKLSNLFVFTSWRETVGNIFQEAKISGCTLVLNENLPCLVEMGGHDAIYINSTHKTPGVRDGRSGDLQLVNYGNGDEAFYDVVAGLALSRIRSLQHQWYFSFDRIWLDQMEPLLRTAYTASRGLDFSSCERLDEWTKPVYIPKPWEAYNRNKHWGHDMKGAPLVPGGENEC